MRLAVINCFILACASVALASEGRSKRHLHQIKEMIANKIFGASIPSQPSEPEVKFFKIPGFDSVVIKAVPKGSETEPPPIIQKIPPDSHIGITGSYLGTDNLNDTYNALLGVKNLFKSGILDSKHAALEDLLEPSKGQYIVTRPLQPCAKAEFIVKSAVEPIPVFLKPSKVPNVVPTQYSYKQINQDGSLTSYTSSLDLNQGVKVTEKGKTVPFFIDRIQNIPVQLPVPVLPDVSKINILNSVEVGFESFPVEVVRPEPSYSYKQVHTSKPTTYSGPPLFNSGDVIVTETRNEIPPPPRFIMDRIEKVAATASYPKVPFIDVIQSRPMAIDVPAGHVMYSAPVLRKPVAIPTPGEYAYTQIDGVGGKTTYLASGAFGDFDDPAVFVTEHKLHSPSLNPFPRPDINTPKPSVHSSASFSYNQVDSGAKVTEYTGGEDKKYGPAPAVLGALPAPEFHGMPAPNSFSYKQVGNGKITTYTGSGIAHESPQVIAKSIIRPVPPPHIVERIERVAAGAKFKRPPILSSPLVSPFAFPVPDSFIRVPSVTPVQQFPVKIPSASSMSPFLYKHIHGDGSVTSFGGDNPIYGGDQVSVAMPIPHTQRVFESPVYTGPYLVDVNPNAIKPSTPVSGSFSYKLINNGQTNVDDMGSIDGHQVYIPPAITVSNKPFPVPSALPPAPVQGCVDPEVENPSVGPTSVIFEEPIPLSYTYKQISHSHPDPFLVVNVEDPVMGAKKIDMDLYMNSHEQQLPNPSPAAAYKDQNPNEHVYVPPSTDDAPQQSSFLYKQVTNQGVYEYSDEYNSSVKTNQAPIVINSQDKPASDVFIAKSPLSSTSSPVLNNRNSLANNPIVVPEYTSFSFKQSNSDGSTITTVMDNGQSSLSVKVEEASKPGSAQLQEAPKVNSVLEQVSQAPQLVSDQMNETPTPSTESVPLKKKLRRRVVKRVKNRGDIPETE